MSRKMGSKLSTQGLPHPLLSQTLLEALFSARWFSVLGSGHRTEKGNSPIPLSPPPTPTFSQGLSKGSLCPQGAEHFGAGAHLQTFHCPKASPTPRHNEGHHLLQELTLYFIDIKGAQGLTLKICNITPVHTHIRVPTLREGRDDGVWKEGKREWGQGRCEQSGAEGGLLRSILLTNMKPGAPQEHRPDLIGVQEGPFEGRHMVPN